jgi:hypothetical protein
MAISVTKSGPYFTGSGAISFSAMRSTFRLNNPTGTISASELLRNTDITNTDPILPDATENSDVSTSSNWKTSQIRDSIKFYNVTQPSGDTNVNLDIDAQSWNGNLAKNIVKKMNLQGTSGSNSTSLRAAQIDQTSHNLTIDVSGNIFGCGADPTVTGPDGLDGGDALGITGGGNNIKVNLQSTARVYAGGGAGEHGDQGAAGANGTCFNYIFGTVASGCGFCGDCSNLGAGYERYGGCNSGGGCNCSGWWFWYGCRQTTLSTAECRKQDPQTVAGGTGGAGGDGGRGRGFNHQSGSIAGAAGAGGGAFVGCGGYTGTITAGGTGATGETGGNGGEWGQSGANTNNTGDGGDPGKAIHPSGITVTGTINSNTIKGSY